jgi:hypothetical protein
MRAFEFRNGDLVFAGNGSYSRVTGNDKVRRDITKLLSTDTEFVGNETTYDRYNSEYGIALNNKKVFAGLSRSEVIEKINAMFKSSLEHYVNIQKNQENLPLDEVVNYFDFFTYSDPVNKTLIRVKLTIYMMSGDSMEMSFYENIF